MTREELQKARELVNKVTDGPWEAHDTTVFAEGIDIGQFDFPEDAEFAAWCREGVPKLLDEVERLRNELALTSKLADAVVRYDWIHQLWGNNEERRALYDAMVEWQKLRARNGDTA
jgi:hypothetical protein